MNGITYYCNRKCKASSIVNSKNYQIKNYRFENIILSNHWPDVFCFQIRNIISTFCKQNIAKFIYKLICSLTLIIIRKYSEKY